MRTNLPTRLFALLTLLPAFLHSASAQQSSLSLSNRAYIHIPSSPDFSSQQFTLSIWIHPTGPGENGGGTLISKSGRPDSGSLLCSWWLGWSTNGRISGLVVHDYANQGTFITSTATVPLGHTAHIALTFDGAILRLYINGILDSQQTFGFSGVYFSNEDIMIGAFNPLPNYTFNRFDGQLDDAAYWNRPLTSNEIAAVASCTSPLEINNLIAYLPFTANLLADASGHNHAALPQGSIAFGPQTAPCPADFNCDAIVDFFDYLDFVDAFSSSAPAADFNHDTIIDFFDYLDFVDTFSSGC